MHVHSSICLVVGQHLITTVRLKVVITSLMNGSITVAIRDKNRRKGWTTWNICFLKPRTRLWLIQCYIITCISTELGKLLNWVLYWS